MKCSFNGINKTITILPGYTNIDVGADLYSAWKTWSLESDNLKFEQAFRTFGGDATGNSQVAPRYYFLQNGWRIIVNDTAVSFQTNLYTEEGDSPFIINNAAVTSRSADVPIIKSVIDENLDYRGTIYVNSASIYSGIEYPVGTEAQPVNNIQDAIELSKKYNIHKLYIRGSFTISEDLTGYSIEGNVMSTQLTFSQGAICRGAEFLKVSISGHMCGGNLLIQQSMVSDLYNVAGAIHESGITGTIQIADKKTLSLIQCVSLNPGSNNPVIDMRFNSDTFLNLRSYTGGINIINCDTTDSVGTLDFVAGKCFLDSTCSSGFLGIKGSVFVTDNSTGTLVDKLAINSMGNIVTADVDLSGIPMDVWSYVSRSLTEEVELLPSQSAKIDQILAKISSTIDANIKSVNDIAVTSVDDFKADVSGISLNVNPADIWNYTNRTLSVPSGLTPAQELLLTNINTNILNVPTNVWNFSTRHLTTDLSSQLVSLPESVWSYTNRSLTSEVNIESTLKTHLLGLTNYDDTALKTQIASVLNKGLDIETKVDAIDVIVKSIPELSEIRNELIDVQFGALEIKNNQMIIKDRHDNIISIFNLFDNNGNPTMSAVYKREVV